MPAPRPILGSRLKLLLIMALFAAPALAAWLAYHHAAPAGGKSHGRLLPPRSPDLPGLDALRGRWVLLVATDGACAEDCREWVRLARQVRLAQGRERERVARAVLAASDLPAEAGLTACALPPGGLADLHPEARPGIHLLDPQGRVMLRFPERPDGRAMIRDLRTLLAVSRTG